MPCLFSYNFYAIKYKLLVFFTYFNIILSENFVNYF